MAITRHFMVQVDEHARTAFCAEVSVARFNPEVVVGTLMAHLDFEPGDDVDAAQEVLRLAMEDEDG